MVSASLATLEAAIGGREALVAALLHAPKSRDLDYLLGLLATEATKVRAPWAKGPSSLADLCAQGGITPGELIAAYRAGELNRAQALATQKIGAHLAEVAEDTMLRALPSEGVCERCDGTGTFVPEPSKKVPNPEPEPCRRCQGTGRIVYLGDLEHKKLALDMGRLVQKGGGVSLNVQQQVGVFTGAAAGGSLERMQAATDAILYGDGAAEPPEAQALLEAEVIEAPETDAVIEGDWREDSA